MARSFLFAAVHSSTWGEILIALKIADQLHDVGHRVVFVAPEPMKLLFAGKPYRYGWIDRSLDRLATALPEIARRERCDAVVLVDCALVYMQLECTGQAAGFVDRFPVPVVALDMWNLPSTDMVWDLGPKLWRHSPHALDPKLRIFPAPLASPVTTVPGTFAALFPPKRMPGRDVRAEFGLGTTDSLVVMPTASWQTESSQQQPYTRKLAAVFPEWIATLVAELGPALRLAHVGPEPMPALATALGQRYRWLDQMPPPRFVELIAAADLLLSFNVSATSIGLAIALETPVLLGQCSHAGEPEEIIGEIGGIGGASQALTDWLHRVGQLHPFRVWPLGYHRFLEPTLSGNPYLDAVCAVEVLDETDFRRTARALLKAGPVRESLRARQSAFAAAVARLPTGANAVLACLK